MWVYVRILLPSIRINIQNELFALRDELRMHKIQNPQAFSDDQFIVRQDAINNLVRLTPKLNIATIFLARHYFQSHDSLHRRSHRRFSFLIHESNKIIRDLFDKSMVEAIRAIVWNSIPFLVVTFPIWLLLIPILGLYRLIRIGSFQIKQFFDNWAGHIAAVPDADISRFVI